MQLIIIDKNDKKPKCPGTVFTKDWRFKINNFEKRICAASELIYSELKTLEWDVFNPDPLINLVINKKRRTLALFHLEIKKKSGSSINPDIHYSKVPSSEL